jgi:hypothetical protein
VFAAAQNLQDRADARTTVAFVFPRRRQPAGLTEIFLRDAQPVLATSGTPAIETFDDERLLIFELADLDLGDGQVDSRHFNL